MARIRFILVVAFLIGFSPVQQTAVAQSTLVAALDAYEKAVVDKLNSDLETIARAFADARDIQRARRAADWAKFPLDVISAALDLPSFIRDFKSIIAGIENADNQLRLASFFFSLHGISESAGGLKLAISGPEYNKAVSDMLAEAGTVKDKKAYQDIISLYLHGIGGRKSPVPIVIEIDQGKQTLPGVREFKSRLRALLDEAKQEGAALSASPETQLKKVIEDIGQATSNVRESKSRHVEISDDVLLGRINPLERVRAEALTRYDRDMKIEQVNTVISSVKTVCNATSYYLTGGITIGNAKQCAPLRDANTVLKSLTLPYHTSARKQVDQLPFEMLLSLPGEAASLWTLTRTLATKINTTTRAPDQVVGSPATSEPPSTVARPDPANVLRSLAGRWEGTTSLRTRFVWTIEEDGRYESTYQEFSRQVKGRGNIGVTPDGSIQYRADDGRQSGAFTVSREASGAQVLRGTVSGSRVTYEAKQVETRFIQRREEPPKQDQQVGAKPPAPGKSAPEPTDAEATVRVTTTDGGVLKGTIFGGTLTMKTAFGELKIEGKRIRSLSGSAVTLDDGSVLKGTVVGGNLQIVSSHGSLIIPGPKIKEIEGSQKLSTELAVKSEPSRQAAESRSKLNCDDALALFGQPRFEFRDSIGVSSLKTVSARCLGVSIEGKSAKALLNVTAAMEPATSSSPFLFQRPPNVGVDPFSGRDNYVPVGTLYEIRTDSFYTAYDTGWRMDSFKSVSGRRLDKGPEVREPSETDMLPPIFRRGGAK